jgi:hypothetical protein
MHTKSQTLSVMQDETTSRAHQGVRTQHSTTAAQHITNIMTTQHANMDGCTKRSPDTQSQAAAAGSHCGTEAVQPTKKQSVNKSNSVFMYLCRGCSEKGGSLKDKEDSLEST